MKYVLSLLVVVLFAASANAAPPWLDKGKFGMGAGKFGNPAHMMQMRERMRDQERPNMERPRRGFRGPAFSHRGPGYRGPKGWHKRHQFRGQKRDWQEQFKGRCPCCGR